MIAISLRKHYNVYLTNTKNTAYEAGPFDLLMPTKPSFRGTPRKILEEIADFRRTSSGCDIAYRITDNSGHEYRAEDFQDEILLQDISRGKY